MVLKLVLPMLTLFGDVWLPKRTSPFLFKCEHIWAGPVSLEIINLAFFIKLIKTIISTGSLSTKTTFEFNLWASSISPGPGAVRIENSFL